VVIMSGDKLLGGPQAGLVMGSTDVIAACSTHPLLRALRPGSLVLESLQETLLAYLRGEARSLPFWENSLRSPDELRERAHRLANELDRGRVTAAACVSTPGGGTMPTTEIASFGLRVEGSWTEDLRRWNPPIIARSAESATWLDLRTVDPSDDVELVAALHCILDKSHAR
jgi:L-seryl-tRNA(Ser) seleniumtransferase